jgi:hypothetical protein
VLHALVRRCRWRRRLRRRVVAMMLLVTMIGGRCPVGLTVLHVGPPLPRLYPGGVSAQEVAVRRASPYAGTRKLRTGMRKRHGGPCCRRWARCRPPSSSGPTGVQLCHQELPQTSAAAKFTPKSGSTVSDTATHRATRSTATPPDASKHLDGEPLPPLRRPIRLVRKARRTISSRTDLSACCPA